MGVLRRELSLGLQSGELRLYIASLTQVVSVLLRGIDFCVLLTFVLIFSSAVDRRDCENST